MSEEGKVVVITGAASGLGLALTQACIAQNMTVVMADNTVEALSIQSAICNQLSASPVLGVVCDVRNQTQVDRLVEETLDHFGRVDWLVNNAGISGVAAPFWELTADALTEVLEINLFGTLCCTRAFLPVMFNQAWRSRVINIASIYSMCTTSCMAAYSMSKHAVLAFSESLYFDCQRLNKPVDVSIVCPSFMNTNLMHATSAPKNNLHILLEDLMKRSRNVTDIAHFILQAIEENRFYILPDQEIQLYAEQRLQGFLDQGTPHKNSLEKLISSLSKRAFQAV